MGDTEPNTCNRCKSNPATVAMRQDTVCESCYANFVSYKVIKRMGGVLRDLRYHPVKSRAPRLKYLLGLSFGPSSAALVHMMDQNARRLEGRNPHLLFELTAVHIDTDLSSPSTQADAASASVPDAPTETLLRKYRSRFPRFSMESVPLAAAFDLDTIDWTALPSTVTTTSQQQQKTPSSSDPRMQLRRLLEHLPSNSSRVDVLRLLVRHLLLDVAMKKGCDALLLGCTTTALAEVTLSETAKGRGHAVPVLIADGPYPVTRFGRRHGDTGDDETGEDEKHGGEGHQQDQQHATETGESSSLSSSFPIYFPMRDVLRREIVQYNNTSHASMAELVSIDLGSGSGSGAKGANVVSHKDLSIEDVMARYFEEVEQTYPSVVTNVVRTSGRLTRPEGDACGLCGMALDEQGDRRWKGEIGEDELDDAVPPGLGSGSSDSRICYGCQRTVRG